MKNYLLFDLDGTLTDPKKGITGCVQYALRSFGIEEPDPDRLERFIGPPLKDSFMEFYGMDEARAQEAVEKYRERFQDTGIFENRVYDGIPAMLRTLQSKGMHLAVASSKPTVFVERILEHFHIDRYFEVVVGSELDGSRSNKDEVVQEALRRLFPDGRILRDQVRMIGDRKFDVEGAKALGVESVGVTYGYGSMEELKEARADYIVRSVEELRKFLLRGTEEAGSKASPSRRIWGLVFPLLSFLLVRVLVMNALVLTAQALAPSLPESVRNLIFVGYGTENPGLTGSAATVITAVAYAAGAAVIWTRARHLIGRTAEDVKLLHLRREPGSSYGLLALVTVGAALGWNLLFDLTGLAQASSSYQEAASSQYAGAFWVGLVCYVLVTPLAEELLFRGILYNELRRFLTVKMAVLASALLFGLYHMNSVQAVYAFLLGCVIAYGYEYFGSFRTAVCIHAAANLLAYCMTYVRIPLSDAVRWCVCIVGLVAMAAGLAALHRRKNVF